MNTSRINEILNSTKFLSKEEINFLIAKINGKENTNHLAGSQEQPTKCVHCSSIKFHKHDTRNNKQRYKCYECKKTLTNTSDTTIKYLHLSHYDKFQEFIKCMINNSSLKRTAEICKVSVSCAFIWRHKIIDSLTNSQSNNQFVSGLIEMDEIYFRKSVKGNIKNGINRKPWKHGYGPNLEDSAGLSKSKICITTAIDRTKNISMNHLGYGKPSSVSLFNRYNNIIKEPKNSKIIVDGDKSYIDFSKQIGCEYKMLTKKNGNNHMNIKMPVIQKENGTKYHIQNINNFHSQIKDIINSKFKGVSLKYLIHYINWVKWLRLNKGDYYLTVNNLIKNIWTQIRFNEQSSKRQG